MNPGPLADLARRFDAVWHNAGSVTFRVPGYAIDYVFRSRRGLVITFDHMQAADVAIPGKRLGWGHAFIAKRGLSALHVKPLTNCWYRRPSIEAFFTAFGDSALPGVFETVMTYGGSMGGFGALSFARLARARRCLALNPQIHLGPSVRDWETRFDIALKQDWTGPLCDVARQIEGVETVAIAYDPWHAPDRRHVELLGDARIVRLRLPFVEHNIPYHLVGMKIAGPVFDACLDGTITEAMFRDLARARRSLPRYREIMLARAGERRGMVRRIEAHTGSGRDRPWWRRLCK